MAYMSVEFASNLAAIAGDDTVLFEELRESFVASLVMQVDLLARARCDGNWRLAAQRLKGLGSSFHARDLAIAAEWALESAPGDPVALRKLNAIRDRFIAQREV